MDPFTVVIGSMMFTLIVERVKIPGGPPQAGPVAA
jgi:hypothetical protein